MLCPNCSESLQTIELSKQTILHCSNCGGTFFEENAINRITAKDARTLANNSSSPIVMGTPKICPHDNIFLHLIENDEAVPQNVMLFKCPKCRGIFAHPDDLLQFKKAQNVKIEFFKVWGNPLPSLKAVLVMGIIGLMSFTVFTALHSPSITSSQAEEVVQSVNFSDSGRYLFVSFRTSTLHTSSIVIKDTTINTKVTKKISDVPVKLHYAALTDINLNDELYYQIIVVDQKGKETKTDMLKLKLQ